MDHESQFNGETEHTHTQAPQPQFPGALSQGSQRPPGTESSGLKTPILSIPGMTPLPAVIRIKPKAPDSLLCRLLAF